MTYFQRRNYLRDIVGAVSANRHVCSTSPSGRIDGDLTALDKIRDVVVLLHGPMGCGYHHRMVARLPYPYYNLRCTSMDEKDVVIGSEDKLLGTIEQIIQNDHPAILAILPSSCSEVLGMDIVDTLKSFAGDQRCKVFAVSPELFSHRDKRSRNTDFAQEVTAAINGGSTTGWGDRERSDCGIEEVRISLVEYAMEPQPPEQYTVNLECGLWDEPEILNGMRTLCASAGIKVRPLNNAQDIIQAPSAALNIAANPCWAKRMQKKFGTDFLLLSTLPGYNSIDGTRRFYELIAAKLGKKEAMRLAIERDYEENRERHEAFKRHFAGQRYALYAWSGGLFSTLKNQQDYGIYPDYVITHTNTEYLLQRGVGLETIARLRRNIEKSLSDAGFSGKLVNEDNLDEVRLCLEDVDTVVGGEWLIRNLAEQDLVPKGLKTQTCLGTYAPLDMATRLRIMEGQIAVTEQTVVGQSNLAQLLREHEAKHPELTARSETAYKGHRAIWFERKEQEVA